LVAAAKGGIKEQNELRGWHRKLARKAWNTIPHFAEFWLCCDNATGRRTSLDTTRYRRPPLIVPLFYPDPASSVDFSDAISVSFRLEKITHNGERWVERFGRRFTICVLRWVPRFSAVVSPNSSIGCGGRNAPKPPAWSCHSDTASHAIWRTEDRPSWSFASFWCRPIPVLQPRGHLVLI